MLPAPPCAPLLDGVLRSQTSKYLLASPRPSLHRPSPRNTSTPTPHSFRIHSAFQHPPDKSSHQAYLGPDVLPPSPAPPLHSVPSQDRPSTGLRFRRTAGGQTVQKRERVVEEKEQNGLIHDIEQHYGQAVQVLENKQQHVDRLIGLLDDYRVTGLRDKDMQVLREELKRFQEESKSLVSRQQQHCQHYTKESAQIYRLQSMTHKYDSLRQKHEQLKDKNHVLKAKVEAAHLREQALTKENGQQKNTLAEQMRKIENLETRLHILLNQHNKYTTTDSLRKTINELLKENEQFKRTLFHKDRLIHKIKEQQHQLMQESERLEKQAGYWQMKVQHRQDLLSSHPSHLWWTLPSCLGTLGHTHTSPQAQMLLDAEVLGAGVLAGWAAQEDQRHKVKESVEVVAQQWVAYKSWGEKVNLMLQSLEGLQEHTLQHQLTTILETQLHAKGTLWLPDHLTGAFSGFKHNTHVVALPEGGLLHQADITLQPVECHQGLLYHIQGKPVRSDQHCMMVPLVNGGGLLGVLEVTDSTLDLHHIQQHYLLVLLATRLRTLLQQYLDIRLLREALLQNTTMRQCYLQLSQALPNQQHFDCVLSHWLSILFNCQSRVLYIDQQQFLLYSQDTPLWFSLERGEAGRVYQEGHSQVVRASSDAQVDLPSLHPVYYMPIKQPRLSLLLMIPLRHCREHLLEQECHKASPGLSQLLIASQDTQQRISSVLDILQAVLQ